MRIVLKTPGFEGYTGPIGSIMFKDGKSEEPVSHREAIRVGSAFHVVFEDGREVSAAAEVIEFSTREMTVQKETPRKGTTVEKESEPEELDSEPEVEKEPEPEAALEEPVPAVSEEPVQLYTREQLEAVADAKGISGLREIGNEHNVRANSIEAMIERLLQIKA